MSFSSDGQTLVWTEAPPSKRVQWYDVAAGSKPVAISLPASAVAPAAPLGQGVVAPLNDGSVALVPRDATGGHLARFLPPLAPDSLPRWTKPAALADNNSFVIGDGRGVVYAVTQKDKPAPALAKVGEALPPKVRPK